MKRISSESVVSSAALATLGLALTIICSRPVHAAEQPQEPEGAQTGGLHVTDPVGREADGEEVSSEDPLVDSRPAARALPPVPAPCQIAIHMKLLQIDEREFAEAKTELDDLIDDDGDPTDDEKRPARTCKIRLLDEGEWPKKLERLRELGVGKVIAEPTVVTLDGREATVHSGGNVPILEVDETVNGERRSLIRYQRIGHTIRVVPKLADQDAFHLGLTHEVNRMNLRSREKLHFLVPDLESRKTETSVKLRPEQTVLLAYRQAIEDGDVDIKPAVLLVAVTPEQVNPIDTADTPNPNGDTGNVMQLAENSTRVEQPNPLLADEIRNLETKKNRLLAHYASNHPKVKSLQSQLDSMRRRQADKLLAAMEREIQTETTDADPLVQPEPAKRRVRSNQEPSPRSPNSGERRVHRVDSGSIRDELQALREDVRAVRRDVNRLIELLEDRQGSKDRSKQVEVPEQKPEPVGQDVPAESWDMTLKEATTIALQNSKTLAVTSVGNRTTIRRATADMSLSDVKDKAANLMKDVEQAYWDLWLAYRNLETTKEARDASLESWRGVSSGKETSDVESDTRKQYFLFRGKVVDSLRAVYAGEHRLRYLLGLSSEDGRLIRPCENPTVTKTSFDWHKIRAEAVEDRTELTRQRWKVRQREAELAAAKAAALPALDASNAQWQPAKKSVAPIGYRNSMAGIRNAQMLLAREQAALEDVELNAVHELTEALRNLNAAYSLAQTHFNRRKATTQEVEALTERHSQVASPGVLADAHDRRAATAIDYWNSLADYANALSNLHLKKGSLLSYRNIVVDDSAATEREKDNSDALD